MLFGVTLDVWFFTLDQLLQILVGDFAKESVVIGLCGGVRVHGATCWLACMSPRPAQRGRSSCKYGRGTTLGGGGLLWLSCAPSPAAETATSPGRERCRAQRRRLTLLIIMGLDR